MCRWLAYTGSPVLLSHVLYTPVHSLIEQSLRSKLGAETTNGDGFGIGWYDGQPTPGLFRSTEPAWNDANLRELAAHVTSPLFFAHVRAAIGAQVQQSNCHPFRCDNWLWMHNGFLDGFAHYKRPMAFAVEPALYPQIMGGTDSELMFYLALSFGLKKDPVDAVARMVGFVESTGHAAGVDFPFQGTIVTSDGKSLWCFRYSSVGKSRSMFVTHDVPKIREMYPDTRVLSEVEVSENSRLVVSEPIGDLPGAWKEVPEATCCIVEDGRESFQPFAPLAAE